MNKILLKNAKLGHKLVNIAIENDIIVSIDEVDSKHSEFNDYKVFDALGNTVMPGLVDVHVHFRDPGLTYKETIKTGSYAAAHGGFTTVFAMPNVKPVVDNPQALKNMLSKNSTDSCIKTYQYASISSNLDKSDNTDIAAMAELGAIAFTNDGHGVQTAGVMYKAMLEAKKHNKAIVAHVEDDSLINNGVMNAGQAAEKLGLPGMNSLSESSQLARDLVLAYKTGVHYHVAHISTAESVTLVRIAKSMGVHVTAEVSPHHLLLDDSMISMDNPMMKMNPPLRSPKDRAALIAGLLDGTIDMVATDHAPHSQEEKTGSMLTASFGIVGLETAFSLMYTKFVKSGLVSLNTLLNWMSYKPLKAFDLAINKIEIGAKANLTVMDLNHAYQIDASQFVSKGKNSPFIGEKVFGKTLITISKGNVAYHI
ncbi:dihydroorotase [Apilactobacillus xinyiensis]|uniref:Dihydroorotase n=1 Tax=Apilactobacillus xinyiensis TaxID=2841032 RepID=A0ABT0I021_9LACO|nr:dihydroorotase [Apilactobacillus xinyiensis]MCK8624188.1 dihydroorotase [Apilactobacillus xinyiensis]MCL0318406.1 dihydroorotase [Apilactobacillus xinyiensis]